MNQNYQVIKMFLLDKTEIRIYIKKIPSEEQIKKKLVQIYDVINEVAESAELRGIDISKWFYTTNQLKKLKGDYRNNFL